MSRQNLQMVAIIGMMLSNLWQVIRSERYFDERNAWKAKAEQCVEREAAGKR